MYPNADRARTRNGTHHFKSDGTFDMRYNDSKLYASRPNCEELVALSSYYTRADITLNPDGTVNPCSAAVRRGEVELLPDGRVDHNCQAVRKGKLLIDSYGNVDAYRMGLV
ncbi:hypothetical protein M9Y10_006213 [Tritrichomonas musculus]|uniref:Uncharacterized protein n=1 Tax=Tritrichomonas musculus TaxID=1915356 RepID=A0ABR2JE65_9EUKA